MVCVSLYQFVSVYSLTPSRGGQILVIHLLVSTLPSRPVSTRLFASIKKGLSARLHIPFNDSHWESPLTATLYLLIRVHLWHQCHRLNRTFFVPTKSLYLPVSKIHRKAELYVLEESAIRLLLLVNVHLFYKAVKKFFLFQVGELII